jgi:hypothetical protein
MSYQRAMSRQQPNIADTVMTYEAAFRLVQQAAEAERSGDPMFAIQLYTDAGEALIKVFLLECVAHI